MQIKGRWASWYRNKNINLQKKGKIGKCKNNNQKNCIKKGEKYLDIAEIIDVGICKY